jgi:DNA-3-methyladenine glycosylase II
MLKFDSTNFHTLCDQLAAEDQDLTQIIRAYGYPPMWNRPNTFETLVHIILEQQVSLASALATLNKLRQKVTDITPENVLKVSDEELRACYFSRQKTVYVRNLAEELARGKLDLLAMESKSDEEVRMRLTALKGLGNWTADIYLIFVLRRTDVFPAGDLAAVNALKRLKKLPRETPVEALLEITDRWQPNRTIATMLLWHYYLSVPAKAAKSA